MSNTETYSSYDKLDILVRIEELLDEHNRRRVEHAMLQAAGIVRARFNDGLQHLLVVGYDPERTDASQILKLFKNYQLNAQLIGRI